MNGTIVTWNPERYFGFIQSPESKENLFFHGSSVVEPPGTELTKGMAVEFQTDHDCTGRPRAINLRVLNSGSRPSAKPTAHRRDGRQRYETAVMSPRQRAERLWTHGGADEV